LLCCDCTGIALLVRFIHITFDCPTFWSYQTNIKKYVGLAVVGRLYNDFESKYLRIKTFF
jgi:hypothetical protein